MKHRIVATIALAVLITFGLTASGLCIDWTHRHAKPIKIKMGSAGGNDAPYFVGSAIMGEIVHNMTQGKYAFEQYPSSQLGDERALVELVQIGTLKITHTSTGPLSAFNDKIGIVDMPYLFDSAEHGHRVLVHLLYHVPACKAA